LKAAKGERPTEPWYDPTSSRRAVREADRLRLVSNTANPSSSASSSTPVSLSNQNLNQPQDDFIDMPVSDNNSASNHSTTKPTTNIESHNHPQHHPAVLQQQIPDEDLSLHGSSVMDETEENERGLGQILDGYDFLSSADSDIDIVDQQSVPSPPVIISPSSSSSTESSYLSSQSTVSNIGSDAAINDTVSVDTELELDER
ncbi:hypothetical protein PS6_011891, partial [Mucor atramentarius]